MPRGRPRPRRRCTGPVDTVERVTAPELPQSSPGPRRQRSPTTGGDAEPSGRRRRDRGRCRGRDRPRPAGPHQALRRHRRGRRDRPRRRGRLVLRHRRAERRGQDHHALDGHRPPPPGRRPGARARDRRLGRARPRQARDRRAARRAAAVRPALRRAAAPLLRRAARARRRDRAAAHRRPRRRVRPRGRDRAPRRRLLGRHDEEDRARRGDDPLAAPPGARRAVRVRRPGVRGEHRRDPAALRRGRRHRRALEPRHGPDPARLRPRRRDRRRPACSPPARRTRSAAGESLEERFVALAGGRRAAAGMEWLHSFTE